MGGAPRAVQLIGYMHMCRPRGVIPRNKMHIGLHSSVHVQPSPGGIALNRR